MNSFIGESQSEACADQLSYLLIDKLWPTGIKMLDAWGKIPDGFLAGNYVSLGHYDQCVNISEVTPVGTIKGKYCLVKVFNLQSTVMGFGACIPEVCEYFRNGFEDQVYCQTKDSYSAFDIADYLALSFFGLVGLIILLSTFYDWYSRRKQVAQQTVFLLFSAITNGEKLFETKIAPDQISCLAGIRVLSMIWIIAAHRYFLLLYIPIKNSIHGFNFLYSNDSFYLQAAYLSVDTFLFIGGFVVAFQCYANRNKLSLTFKTIPHFYLFRLLRLLPVMAVVYIIHVTIIRRMSSGPLYPHLVESMRQPCVKHWWPYFFFYQNYAYGANSITSECLPHSWYLNVDLQLYLITPFLIIPTTRYLKDNETFKCYATFIIAVLLSVFAPMLIMFVSDYKYQHSHTRASPYIIGLLMGLFVVENRHVPYKIPTKLFYATWTIVVITMGVCMYYIQNTQLYRDDRFNNNMFITFGRPAWCACLSWIIFCCVTGNADILNKILSNSLFLVVGRLSFSMYLLQVLVLVVTMGSTRTPYYMNFWSMLHGSVSDIFITTLLSIICVLSFESPTIAFAKLLLNMREPQVATAIKQKSYKN